MDIPYTPLWTNPRQPLLCSYATVWSSSLRGNIACRLNSDTHDFPWMWPSSGVVWLKIVRLQEKDAAHAEKMMCSSVVSYGSRMCSISSIHLQVWSTHFPMGANGLWPLGTLTLIISKFSWQLRWSSSPCSARRPATCLSASLSRATCSYTSPWALLITAGFFWWAGQGGSEPKPMFIYPYELFRLITDHQQVLHIHRER